MNADPTVPAAAAALEMRCTVLLFGTIAMRNDAVPLPSALVAVRATVAVVVLVGVPEMMPVAASKTRPAGSPVAANVVGRFVAVTA